MCSWTLQLYILTRLDIRRVEAIFRENFTRRQVDPRDFMAFYDAQIETGRKKRVGTRVSSLYLSLRFSVGYISFARAAEFSQPKKQSRDAPFVWFASTRLNPFPCLLSQLSAFRWYPTCFIAGFIRHPAKKANYDAQGIVSFKSGYQIFLSINNKTIIVFSYVINMYR